MVTEHRFASPQTNVTNHTNQERTKRYDCIPLPTKSATASNPSKIHPVIGEFLTVLSAIELELNNVSLSNWISALTLNPNPPKGCSHVGQTRDEKEGKETVRA